MIRRVVWGVGGATLLAVLFFGRDAASYVVTTAGWARDSVKGSVPIEFEIDRARRMVKDLVPDIQKNMHVIAKEEVEVERLKEQIAKSEAGIEKARGDLVRLKSDLANGQDVFKYAGRTYTTEQVKTDLANRFTRFKTADATLASLHEIHDARQRSLESARQKLEGMLAAKRQLEVDVENLEARLKAVEVAQTTSEASFDESRLSRTKELVSDLRTRLDVAEKMVNAETTYHDQIPLDEPTPDNIIDQVTEYLGGDAPAVAKTAAVARQ